MLLMVLLELTILSAVLIPMLVPMALSSARASLPSVKSGAIMLTIYVETSALSMPTALKTQLVSLLIVKVAPYGTMPKSSMLPSSMPTFKTTDRELTSWQSSAARIKLLPLVVSMQTLLLLSSTLTLATSQELVMRLLPSEVAFDRKLTIMLIEIHKVIL